MEQMRVDMISRSDASDAKMDKILDLLTKKEA
jgi:hypothetical protein